MPRIRLLMLVLMLILACSVPFWAGGCQPVRWEFNRETFRYERVGPRDRPAPVDTPATQPAVAETDSPRKPAHRQVRATKRTAIARSDGSYRLGIVQGQPSVERSEQSNYDYAAQSTSPGKLAALLVVLFPGQGPGGNETERYIIYNSAEVWREAIDFLPRLDPAKVKPAANVPQAWPKALNTLYASRFPVKLERQQRSEILSMLHRVLNDHTADRELRWAAGIIAAGVHSRYHPQDHLTARAALGVAERAVVGLDYQSLVVRYHRIKLLMAEGSKRQARHEVREVFREYPQFKKTACCRIMRTMTKK